jgi:hypothetical protein
VSPQDDRDGPDGSAAIDFSLVTGDPLHHAQRLIGLIPARGLGTGRRIAIAVGITWLPLALWAAWNHLFLPGVAEEPLLRHFGIHARFLVALPLFLASEGLVEGTLRRILPQFLSSGLIDAALLSDFRRTLHGAVRLRDSRLALAVILGLVAAASVSGWEGAEHDHELVWAQAMAGHAFATAWFTCVSRPIFLLVLVAWLWRLAVVTRLFQCIAALDLRLAPTHPDRTAGLAFVEKLPPAFAPFFFGIAIVIAGRWGHDALYHGLAVEQLGFPAGVLVALSVLIGMAPLLVFVGRLTAVKRRSLVAVGALLADYGRLFERRWLRRESVQDAGLLDAPEIGPVADTVGLYEAVYRMRVVPVSRASILPLALAAAAPLVPVFATQMPLKDAIMKLLAPLLGL